MILDAIFEQLKEEIAKGAALPVPVCPALEEEYKKFVLRPMTEEELALMAARDAAMGEAEKMVVRVMILHQVGMMDSYTTEDIKRDEEAKFKATMLGDVFFWGLQASTGWKFASLLQRVHEGQVVLVGLPVKEARAHNRKHREAREMADLIGTEMPKPRLVN
jgi:hypothetical protein